jgi:hypothetical protein
VENGIGAKKYPKDKLQFIEQKNALFFIGSVIKSTARNETENNQK